MEFRRSGQRDPRRRRVMIDERVVQGDRASTSHDASSSTERDDERQEAERKHYSDEALGDCRRHVTDLVPTRLWLVTLWLLLALGAVAAIEALYLGSVGWALVLGGEYLTALDVTGSASLAGWFSSLLLLLAAMASVVIYTLRRHKIDDYRGRYRIWLWTAAALLLLSLNATAPLHRVVQGLLIHASGTPLYGDGAIWWIALYGLLLGGLAVRMMVEMWQSRGAVVALTAGLGGYAAVAAIQLDLVAPRGDAASAAVAQSTAVLLGHLGVSLAVALYARYVLLDAQGRLPQRAERAQQPVDEQAEQQRDKAKTVRGKRVLSATRIDPPHRTTSNDKTSREKKTDLDMPTARGSSGNSPSHGQSATAPKTSRQINQAEAEELARLSDGRPLSKSQRRRLKKLQKRSQRQQS